MPGSIHARTLPAAHSIEPQLLPKLQKRERYWPQDSPRWDAAPDASRLNPLGPTTTDGAREREEVGIAGAARGFSCRRAGSGDLRRGADGRLSGAGTGGVGAGFPDAAPDVGIAAF